MKSLTMKQTTIQLNRSSGLTNEVPTSWDAYIGKVFSGPEHTFKPNKGRDTALKIKLDSHGMTIQQAFNAVRMFVEEHSVEGSKYLVVITGKSGKIAEEFPDWCKNLLQIRQIEPMSDTRGQ